jgi:cytochrome b subunit of formate dehydrogenase
MYGAERVQHILLVASFSILVWSGFALKYPDSWWARPILAWESNWPVRGTIHRISAVVMVGVALAHVVTLFVSKRLREHWLHLWPGWRDVVEAVQMLAYNVGLRSNRPVPGAHSYVEKLEYWAVVWGTVVMGLTGFLLWGNRLALAWLPKVWLDLATTVHFYEALLATLSIVVWHFYTVIFDPDVYPMDPAWLTGYSVRRRIAHASEKQFDRRLVTDPTGGLEAATPIQDRATHDNTESPVG